ncbi:MAG: fibrobacter succinogenes major paralogous domain-containing protein [Chitinispirillales bacterium]|jgi:uncharacterized protein (TIGR02145 family)|nr:fibrobacter succinogenes major paralogous domain-containing protein [Chitinispirillales bacterium]
MGRLVGSVGYLFFGVVIIGAFSLAFGGSGSFTDPRDGQTYRTVTIGNQTWMAENLNFNASGSWCYDDGPANCDLYGRLYDWNTVMAGSPSSSSSPSGVQGICPDGWHVPSDDEWTTLVNFVNTSTTSTDNSGTRLKALIGWDPWSGTLIPGTDDHGFSALPGGGRYADGTFWVVGTYGNWWSATEYDASSAWRRGMLSDASYVYSYRDFKTDGFSLRCVQK